MYEESNLSAGRLEDLQCRWGTNSRLEKGCTQGKSSRGTHSLGNKFPATPGPNMLAHIFAFFPLLEQAWHKVLNLEYFHRIGNRIFSSSEPCREAIVFFLFLNDYTEFYVLLYTLYS